MTPANVDDDRKSVGERGRDVDDGYFRVRQGYLPAVTQLTYGQHRHATSTWKQRGPIKPPADTRCFASVCLAPERPAEVNIIFPACARRWPALLRARARARDSAWRDPIAYQCGIALDRSPDEREPRGAHRLTRQISTPRARARAHVRGFYARGETTRFALERPPSASKN